MPGSGDCFRCGYTTQQDAAMSNTNTPSLFGPDAPEPHPPAQQHSATSVAAADAIAGMAGRLRKRLTKSKRKAVVWTTLADSPACQPGED